MTCCAVDDGYDVGAFGSGSKIGSGSVMWSAQQNESCGNNEVSEGSLRGFHSEKDGHEIAWSPSAEARSTFYGERKRERERGCVCGRREEAEAQNECQQRNKVRCSLRSIHNTFDAIRSPRRRRPLLARQCQARLARPLPPVHELY
jgi:hypothetical protein